MPFCVLYHRLVQHQKQGDRLSTIKHAIGFPRTSQSGNNKCPQKMSFKALSGYALNIIELLPMGPAKLRGRPHRFYQWRLAPSERHNGRMCRAQPVRSALQSPSNAPITDLLRVQRRGVGTSSECKLRENTKREANPPQSAAESRSNADLSLSLSISSEVNRSRCSSTTASGAFARNCSLPNFLDRF